MKKVEIKYVLMKNLIMHATTAEIKVSTRYIHLTQMSGNDECPSENFGDSSQLNNRILDSRAMCHMTLEVSDLIPCSLKDMDKYIEVADRNNVTAKQKGQV